MLFVLLLLQVVWTSEDVGRQVQAADHIAVGHVKSAVSEAATTPEGDQLIVTRVRVAVDETVKGQPEAETEVLVEGGTLNGFTMAVSETRVPKTNDRVLVFKRGKRFAKGRDVQVLDDSPDSQAFLQSVRARAKQP